MKERWMPVRGYESAYEISDRGRLRRTVNRFGNASGRMRRPGAGRGGYPRYALSFDAKIKHYTAHRLIWEAFVGPIPEGMQINHKNGVKTDNRLSNLELVTPSENTQHAHRVLGYVPKKPPRMVGSANHKAIIKEEDVPVIRRLYAEGYSQVRIAKMFGIGQKTISLIVRNKLWKHVQ